jgi:hypothetical protein
MHANDLVERVLGLEAERQRAARIEAVWPAIDDTGLDSWRYKLCDKSRFAGLLR